MIQDFFQYYKCLDVKSPTRGTRNSAGIDFYVPNYSKEFITLIENDKSINLVDGGFVIEGHEDILIPSGLHVRIPENTALIAYNKSGVAVRHHLVHGACVVDSDYRDMLKLHLINTSNESVFINFGEKILQFILMDIYLPIPEQKHSLDALYDNHVSERLGGFGSTGTN